MSIDEKIEKMYEGIIAGDELTTKNLNGYGLNSIDIKSLRENGTLLNEKRGMYKLVNLEGLFYYGKKLVAEKEYDKATTCFKRVHEINPNHAGACFQLFLRSIQKKNYEEAFTFFDVLSNDDNKFYNNDFNFYLYLLSIITKLPDGYIDYARFMSFDDIKVFEDDKRYSDKPSQNKFRNLVLQRKLPYAKTILEKSINEKEGLTVQNILLRELINQAINVEKQSRKNMLTYIKDKNYDELDNYLKEKSERHKLSQSEEYALKIVKSLKDIRDYSLIPNYNVGGFYRNAFEAIDENDFFQALELSRNYAEHNNIIKDTNYIYLLLEDICNLIKENNQVATVQSTKSEELKQNEQQPIVEETKKEIKDEESVPKQNNAAVPFSIISYLMNNDFDNAYQEIDNYLSLIDKMKYKYLILDLIKIGVLENDIGFTKAMLVLTMLEKEDYTFDITKYVASFYQVLSDNKIDQARVYLDIISKSDRLNKNVALVEGLQKILSASTKVLEKKKEETASIDTPRVKVVSTTPVYAEEENIVTSNDDFGEQQDGMELDNPFEEDDDIMEFGKSYGILENQSDILDDSRTVAETSFMDISEEEQLLEEKHKHLVEYGGIIRLKPMPSDKRKIIHKLVEKYDDMSSFSILEGDKRHIVLRYRQDDNALDFGQCIREGNEAFKNHDYNKSIECYKKVLHAAKFPRGFIYGKIGLAYLSKHNKAKAIDYLTIGNFLGQSDNIRKVDYTDLLIRITDKTTPQEERKTNVKFNKNEFNADESISYGIDNLDEIIEYAITNDLDMETACEKLNIPLEQRDLIKLLYAREFYKQGDIERGDIYLNIVENTPNKTKEVKALLKQIKERKKFLQHRDDVSPKKLVYVKPGKRKK